MPCNARASGKKRKSAYDRRRLRCLDGKTVCLDWRAGASLVGFLVLALDLIILSVHLVTSSKVYCGTHSVLLGNRHGGGSCGYVGVEARGNVLHIARESAISLIRVSLSA
jgi:hypothetical protein